MRALHSEISLGSRRAPLSPTASGAREARVHWCPQSQLAEERKKR